MSPPPPRLAERLLAVLLRPALRGEALDELAEVHALRVQRDGRRAADAWYRRQVVPYAARLSLSGDLQRDGWRPRARHAEGRNAMGIWWSDLRYALRTLPRNPGFTAIAVLTLALGIGANVAIFSVVRTVLLRPLPFADPERIVQVWETRLDRGWDESTFTYANFWDVRDMNRTFDALAALAWSTVNMTGEGDPERLAAMRVSADFFRVLGVNAVVGRTFVTGEDEPQADRGIAVLNNGYWQRRFAGDREVVGRSVVLDGVSHVIIGVLPPGEPWLNYGSVFLPLEHRADADRDSFELNVIGRLRPGVGLEAARADLDDVAARLAEQYPEPDHGMGMTLSPSSTWVADDGLRRALWMLMGGVGLLLLIACVNIANLLLARATSRTRERALRTAMGARRVHLVSLVLSEALAIGALGAAVGLALAYGAVRVLRALQPGDIPRLGEVAIDGQVLAFTLFAALLTGLVVGIVPALRSPHRDIVGALREGERGVTGQRLQARLRGVLVGVEVALSLVLLVGAGLLARSFGEVLAVDRGFASDSRTFMQVALSSDYDRAGATTFLEEFLGRVAALPQVQAAAAVNYAPLRGTGVGMGYAAADQSPPADDAVPWAAWRLVTADYFDAMGVPVLAGRAFSERDQIASPWRVLVSRSIADALWPDTGAVGRTLLLWKGQNEIPAEVIGVVGDMRDGSLEAGVSRTVYMPYYGAGASTVEIVVHGAAVTDTLVPAVRAILADIDRDLPLSDIRTLDDMVGASLAQRRFLMLLLVAFAAVALLLALAGVYGVLAYAMARRRAEIGTRLALGASRARVLRLIVLQGMRPVVAGLAFGLAAAAALSRIIASLLFEVTPVDLATYAAVTVLLAVAAVLSCWIPARRATRLDIVAALHGD